MKQTLILLLISYFAYIQGYQYNSGDTMQAFAYSKISYCPSDQINSWSCGTDCDALPQITDANAVYDTSKGT